MTGSGTKNKSEGRARFRQTAFFLWTGPLAWIVQLCVGETLVGWPCFPATQRLIVPLAGYGWTGIAALTVLLVCALLAFVAGWRAWAAWRAIGSAPIVVAQADTRDRAGFVAHWGAILGLGFGLATLVTLVAFAMVPQCLG